MDTIKLSIRSQVFETNSSSTHVYIEPPKINNSKSRYIIEEVRKRAVFVDKEKTLAVFPIEIYPLALGGYNTTTEIAPDSDDEYADDPASKIIYNISVMTQYILLKLSPRTLNEANVKRIDRNALLEVNKGKHKYAIGGLNFYFDVTKLDKFLYAPFEELDVRGPVSLLGIYFSNIVKQIYGFSVGFPLVDLNVGSRDKPKYYYFPYTYSELCSRKDRISLYLDYIHIICCSEGVDFGSSFSNALSNSDFLKSILLGNVGIFTDGC